MSKSIEAYIAQGFTPEAAAYFAAGRRRITAVSPEGKTLLLTFDNGEHRRYDMTPHLTPGTVFEPLMQPSVFQRVFLDEGIVSWDVDPAVDSSVHWSNRIDLCPDTCYLDSLPV